MDPNVVLGAVGTAVGALGGLTGVASVLVVRGQRRKLQADTAHALATAEQARAGAADQITETALQLIEPLKRRIGDLEHTVKVQGEEMGLMRRTLTTVYLEIMSPEVTIPALREFAMREIAVRYVDRPGPDRH